MTYKESKLQEVLSIIQEKGIINMSELDAALDMSRNRFGMLFPVGSAERETIIVTLQDQANIFRDEVRKQMRERMVKA